MGSLHNKAVSQIDAMYTSFELLVFAFRLEIMA